MGKLLVETLEAVWASTRRPDELLLIDDGSEGAATREAIAALERAAAARSLPLEVVRQENRGLAAARNAGLAAARGELISFLDGDDLMEPAFYDLAATLLDRYPDLGGVAAWALCFGEGIPDGFWNAPQPELPLLLVENPVFVPCMMRTETVRGLGGYDTAQRYNYEDWELGVRLVASGHPVVTIPLYLERYRVRADSLLRTRSDVQHQRMREVMLERHRETVSRFAVETAMLLEHQLARRLYAVAAPPTHHVPSPSTLDRILGRGRRGLARASSLLVGRRRR
jgi:glycosyltransferase involved in cell wall biosynthesis